MGNPNLHFSAVIVLLDTISQRTPTPAAVILTTFARQRTTQDGALLGQPTAFASARLSSFQNFKSGTEVAQRDFLPVRNGGIFRSFEVEIGTDFTMYFESGGWGRNWPFSTAITVSLCLISLANQA